MNLRASPAPLTAGEFELMEILWRLGEASVKQVWKHVEPERKLAYTTVMTVLDKMRRKGLVLQRKQGRAYFYQPALDRGRASGRSSIRSCAPTSEARAPRSSSSSPGAIRRATGPRRNLTPPHHRECAPGSRAGTRRSAPRAAARIRHRRVPALTQISTA